MRLGVYTIPHTGTRFVTSFLNECGIEYTQRHVASERKMPEWRHVLTVRNPYHAYLTMRKRFPSNSDVNFVAMWGHYIWRTQWQDAFYVALEVVPENRRAMMQQLVSFCNGTPDFSIIDPFCERWEKVGSVGDKKEQVPEHMIKPLEFAYQWYEYYTTFPGMYIRHSRNTLGEGN